MMPIACWLGPVGIAYCLLAERQTGSHTDSVQCSDVACMSESALSVASGCSTHILLTHPWRPAGHPLCLRRVQPPLAHTSDMYAGPRSLSILLLCPILQAYLKHCLQYILDNCSEDLEFFAHQNDKALVQRLQVCIHIPCQASRIGKLGPALPYPALPCPALPCPALLCSALPCPALPCPALPCLHYSAIHMPWSFPAEKQVQVCTCRPCIPQVAVRSCRALWQTPLHKQRC